MVTTIVWIKAIYTLLSQFALQQGLPGSRAGASPYKYFYHRATPGPNFSKDRSCAIASFLSLFGNMKTPNDFELNTLARRSGEITFDDSLHARFTQLSQSGIPFRNCYAHTSSGKWNVVIFAGKTQRRIGLFDSGYFATRFANMATYYFWKHRKTEKACTDGDLIYGVDQAKADLGHYLGATMHLTKIEGHLISIGAFAVGEQAEQEKQISDLRSQVRKHARAWNAYLRALKQLQSNYSGPGSRAHFEVIESAAANYSKLIHGVHQLKPTD